MKTISQINQEIKDLHCDMERMDEKEEKQAASRCEFLRKCIAYLETNPRPEFLFDEQTRLNNIVAYVQKTEVEKEFTPERRKEFRSEMGFAIARKQVQVISYLLGL